MARKLTFNGDVYVGEKTYRVSGTYYPGSPGTYWDPPEYPEADIKEVEISDDDGKTFRPFDHSSMDSKEFDGLYDAVMESDLMEQDPPDWD